MNCRYLNAISKIQIFRIWLERLFRILALLYFQLEFGCPCAISDSEEGVMNMRHVLKLMVLTNVDVMMATMETGSTVPVSSGFRYFFPCNVCTLLRNMKLKLNSS